VVPGLPELVEAHRSDRLDPDDVRRLTFPIDQRGYSVLLGRRRRADWVTVRRRSVDAALDALARSFDVTVADVPAELDGQAQTGSMDLEDRHAPTLAALATADVVLVTGHPDLHGLHALVDLLGEVVASGVPPERVVPVVVGVPRAPATRARLTAATARLSAAHTTRHSDPIVLHPAVLLPRIRHLDDRHDRVAPLPSSLTGPLGRLCERLLGELAPRSAAHHPERIRTGELGTELDPWDDTASEVA
jgi:hypothetical protein